MAPSSHAPVTDHDGAAQGYVLVTWMRALRPGPHLPIPPPSPPPSPCTRGTGWCPWATRSPRTWSPTTPSPAGSGAGRTAWPRSSPPHHRRLRLRQPGHPRSTIPAHHKNAQAGAGPGADTGSRDHQRGRQQTCSDPAPEPDDIASRLDTVIEQIAATGATVVMFDAPDIGNTPVMRSIRGRVIWEPCARWPPATTPCSWTCGA